MNINLNHLRVFEVMTRLSIDRASRALSKTLKTGAKITLSNIHITDLSGATEKMNEDTREMAGVMVDFSGNVACKLLFMLPLEGTLILTDLFLINLLARQRNSMKPQKAPFRRWAILLQPISVMHWFPILKRHSSHFPLWFIMIMPVFYFPLC